MFQIQNLREHRLIKWLVYFFFGLIIISFIFFYGWNSSSAQRDPRNQKLAKLRSDSIHPLRRWDYITPDEAQHATRAAQNEKMSQLPYQFRQFAYQQGLMDKMVTRDDILRTAADIRLMERSAQKLGIPVDRQEVIDQLAMQPGMSDDRLDMMAQQYQMTKHQLLEMIRQMDEGQRVREVKGLVAHASLFELWQEYTLAKEKITLELAAYPATAFEKDVTVTDADLEKYLADHRDQFHVDEQRRYAYVKLSKQDLQKSIQPTTDTLQAYFEKNKAQYVEKAQTKTEEIFAPLGEDKPSTGVITALEAVRAEAGQQDNWTSLSLRLTQQNPGTRFMRNEQSITEDAQNKPEEYIARMKTLAENQVSTPIVTSNGIYMIRVKSRTPERTPALAEVRAKVEEDVINQQATEMIAKRKEVFDAEIKKLQADNATTNSITRFAQAVGLKDELTTKVKSTDAMIPGAGSFDQDIEYISGLVPGQLSQTLEVQDGLVVLQVVEQTPAYDPELKEIRAEVEKAVRKEGSVAKAKAAAEQSMNLIHGGAEFKTAVANAPTPAMQTQPFTREEPLQTLGAPLIDFQRQTLKIAAGSTGLNAYGDDPEKPLGYAVWVVKKIDSPTQAQFAKERREFEQDYMQIQHDTLAREWLKDQRTAARFEILTDKDKKAKDDEAAKASNEAKNEKKS